MAGTVELLKMNSILLLGFLTLSSSTPLGWNPANEGWYGTGIGSFPAQQASLQIGLQIQKALEQNAAETQESSIPTAIGNQNRQGAAAQHVAQEIVNQALQAKQEQTAESIEELTKKLQQQSLVSGARVQRVAQQAEQISTIGAINKLQQHVQMQQYFAPLIQSDSPLAQTLEAVIHTQMVSDSVDLQQFGLSGLTSQTPEQSSSVFQAKIQQLVDQNNIQEIQAEIARQQSKVQQLQQQQLFLNQQRQQIETQKGIVQKQSQDGTAVVQLQQTQQVLQLHEQQLVKQLLARQLVIQQLQQALIEQQQQLQQDILSEEVAQSWAKRQNPWAQESQQALSAQWSKYEYPNINGSPWNLIRRPWDQSGRSWFKLGNSYKQPRYTPSNADDSWFQGVWSI